MANGYESDRAEALERLTLARQHRRDLRADENEARVTLATAIIALDLAEAASVDSAYADELHISVEVAAHNYAQALAALLRV